MSYGRNGRILIWEIPWTPLEFLAYLEYFWHNFWTRNAGNSIKGFKNVYFSLESKNTASHKIGAWDRMMTSYK